MRQRLFRVTQTKCNFCFDWSQGSSKNGAIFCCDSCLANCKAGSVELTTPAGDSYRMLLIKQEHTASGKKMISQTLEELMSQEYQDSALKWSRVCSLISQNQFSPQELELIETQLNQFSKDHQEETGMFLQRLKNINGRVSTAFSDRSNPSLDPTDSQRCYEPLGVTQSLQTSHNRRPINHDQRRRARGYQFYFDSQDLQVYMEQKQSTPKYQEDSSFREFGTEISICSNRESLMSRRKSLTRKREQRSMCDESLKDQKLTEEEIRSRLGAYLESKYPSNSLHRLMFAFIRQAYARTSLLSHTAQLISFKITSMDLVGWLQLLDFDSITTIKLVNSGLTDGQLSTLLDFITDKGVQRLVLTGNKLSDNCISMFLSKALPNLKELYLAKNRINGYRMRENIIELRQRYILYL